MTSPILLIEDDLSLAEAMTLVLEDLGMPVEHCATGELAIELIHEKRYAVAIVDVVLQAGVSGIYVVTAVRRIPADRRPLVLMVTGANIENLRGLDRSLVTAVMLKPLDFELFGQYVLAMYRKAVGLSSSIALGPAGTRVRTFCGHCGAEIKPWIAERSLQIRAPEDDSFATWADTPCRSCGVAPRQAGGRTVWAG